MTIRAQSPLRFLHFLHLVLELTVYGFNFRKSFVESENAEDVLLNTPSSARSLVGTLGTYGAAYSPRFAPRPPLVCRASRHLGRPHSRGGARAGALLGRVPRGPSERLPFGRRQLGWVPYYRVLPPPACGRPSIRAAAGSRVRGWCSSGSGCVVATCGTLEPRIFNGDSHTGALPRGRVKLCLIKLTTAV